MISPAPPPLVSVVVPTYGHRDFVLAALESVFAQTFAGYEVIVINDGSPDDTGVVLRPLAEAGRIRYLAQENRGQAAARNRGIAEARGEFIALLDDDDLWPQDKLAWQVEALRAHPAVSVVYGAAACVDVAGRNVPPEDHRGEPLPTRGPSGRVYRQFLLQRNRIVSPGQCLLRRAALEDLGEPPFDTDPALRGCDDWDLWLRLAEHSEFLFVDRVALRYRLHAGNASRRDLRMHCSSMNVYRKHLRRSRVGDGEHVAVVARAYREAREWSPGTLLAQARRDLACRDVGGALAKAVFVVGAYPDVMLRRACARLRRRLARGGGT